jgi:hypothetical protein
MLTTNEEKDPDEVILDAAFAFFQAIDAALQDLAPVAPP